MSRRFIAHVALAKPPRLAIGAGLAAALTVTAYAAPSDEVVLGPGAGSALR